MELMIAVVIVGLDKGRKEDVKSLQSMTSVPNAQITFLVNVTENHCKFIELYCHTNEFGPRDMKERKNYNESEPRGMRERKKYNGSDRCRQSA